MRIVIGVDGSEASLSALELVASTAWPAGTNIRLVGAYERPLLSGLSPVLADAVADETKQRALFATLQSLSKRLTGNAYTTETVVARGRPANVLLTEADDLRADIVVVGSRGLGAVPSALLGSVSATLVDHAPCPVLVARRPRVTRIVLATDGSQSAEAIPGMLLAWNVFADEPIKVVSVAPSPTDIDRAVLLSGLVGEDAAVGNASHEVDRHRLMADEMARRLVAGGRDAEGATRNGEAATEIEAAAAEWGADLIVTGSRGLSGLKRLIMGSVAHHVLLHSRSSVLVMRGHVPARQPREVPVAAVGLL